MAEDGVQFRAKADELIKVDRMPTGKGAAHAAQLRPAWMNRSARMRKKN